MKTYIPLDRLKRSRDSGSALYNMHPTDVLGRAGGGIISASKQALASAHISPVISLLANEAKWHFSLIAPNDKPVRFWVMHLFLELLLLATISAN